MNRGFTLLELLITLTIIGVLLASAIPYFQGYRKRAFDFRAQNDLRNVAIAEEAYFIDTERYLSCNEASCNQLPGIKKLSNGVALAITARDDGFSGTATHP